MRDNIANVFGPRTVEALMPIEAPLGDLAHASGYVRSRKLAASDSVEAELKEASRKSCLALFGCIVAGTSPKGVLPLASLEATSNISSSTDAP